MSNENADEAAFACASSRGHQMGLSKREYMATHMLAAIIAGRQVGIASVDKIELAEHAVTCADALLAALGTQTETTEK